MARTWIVSFIFYSLLTSVREVKKNFVVDLVQPHPKPLPPPPIIMHKCGLCFFTVPITAYIMKGGGKHEWWTLVKVFFFKRGHWISEEKNIFLVFFGTKVNSNFSCQTSATVATAVTHGHSWGGGGRRDRRSGVWSLPANKQMNTDITHEALPQCSQLSHDHHATSSQLYDYEDNFRII